jgi:predicted HTH domain antitoxin
MKALPIDLPDDLLAAIGEERARSLAREAIVVKLYELGEISTGRAAELLALSRREMLDLLGRHGVSEFDDATDIGAEARRG